MYWQYSPYTLISWVATGLASFVAISLWRKHSVPGAAPFAFMMGAGAVWAFANGLEISAVELQAKILWSKFEYLGITSVPVLWLIFTLHYTRQGKWLNTLRAALLCIIPILTLLLTWTNELHGLVWKQITPLDPALGAGVIFEHGAWFWVHVVYSYCLLLAGSLVLVWAILRFPGLYRRQAVALLVGMSFPWIGNIIYLSGLNPQAVLDLTPLAFTLSGLVYMWGVFRLQIFDIIPVARDLLIERMSDGVIVLDMQHRVVDINQAAQNLIPAVSFSIGDNIEQALAGWPELLDACCQVEGRQTEILLDGRCLDLRISPLIDQKGTLIGLMILLRDITSSKEIEEKLRLQSVALESAVNAFAITDRSGAFVWVNPAFTRLTGYTAEEVIGQDPRLLKSGVHDKLFYKGLWDTVVAGNIWHGELINRRKDGTLYIEEQTITPVQQEDGEITHFIAIKQDVTARKEVEKLRDDLTDMMVHDLRNPLGRITLALDMLAEEPLSVAERQNLLEISQQGTLQMSNLVNALLDISRLEKGQMPLDHSLLDLGGVVMEAIKVQAPLAEEKGIGISRNVPASLPLLRADPGLLSRVLQNLVGNAIKFTPPGGAVYVMAREDHANKQVLVSVSDSGPGISPDMKDQLFQKFATGREEGRGSGLGLAFCRLAVEAHGGRIWVESTPGFGANFTFSLPLELIKI